MICRRRPCPQPGWLISSMRPLPEAAEHISTSRPLFQPEIDHLHCHRPFSGLGHEPRLSISVLDASVWPAEMFCSSLDHRRRVGGRRCITDNWSRARRLLRRFRSLSVLDGAEPDRERGIPADHARRPAHLQQSMFRMRQVDGDVAFAAAASAIVLCLAADRDCRQIAAAAPPVAPGVKQK